MPDESISFPDKLARADYAFTTTHWSVVLAAGKADSGQAHSALEELCRTYWFPLYAYVRRAGHNADEAQDLTQEFFLRLLEKKSIRLADSARGKFRSFLLTSLKNFLVNEWEKGQAAKRGGGLVFQPWEQDDPERRYQAEPASDITPERLFEKKWAVALVERAQACLQQEYKAANKLPIFEHLKDHVWGEGKGYDELAAQLNMTEGALRIATHRMRDRFRRVLREEVANTASNQNEIDEELRYLISLLRA